MSRGRGISNAPAWMTRGAGAAGGGPSGEVDQDDFGRHRRPPDSRGGPPPPVEHHRGGPPPSDHHGRGGPPLQDRRGGPPPMDFNNNNRGPPRGRDNWRGGPPGPPHRGDNNNWNNNRGGRGRGGSGGPPRGRPRNKTGMVYFNSWEEERAWVEDRRRKRLTRKSLWDVPPTADQVALDARSAAMTNFAATDFSGVDPTNANLPQQTRHARRLYVGNLPTEMTEDSLHKFFRDSIETALVKKIDEDPILSVYINHERRFCFLEFKSVEMTTACMALDGINVFGRGKVKVKRPNDYNLAMAPHSTMLPEMDVSKLGIISSSVPDGPDKIFIGGLHYHLTEEQVLELLGAFGKVKAFHLVKQEPDATTSKGYCFVEYVDHSVTQVAVMGLNGMDLGQGKILTSRIANEKDNAMVPPIIASQQNAPNLTGQYNVEELVDAAMGLRPMPTAPSLLGLPVVPLVPISNGLPPPPPPPRPPPAAVVAAAVPSSVLDIANKALSQAFPDQTRILVLLNMVAEEDLATDQDHQELTAEVREECAKFGNLLSIKIPRPQDPGIEQSAVKKIFLEYATVQDAAKAQGELNGRKFGSNTVLTSFLSEGDYAAGKLK